VLIPAGADVLHVRTIKRDGSIREPEPIAEKESVSVPDLLPGDYVEIEYIEAASPAAAFPGGFIGERFYFNSVEAPLERTEYLVVSPVGMAIDVDARGGIEREPRRWQAGDLDVRMWGRTDQPERPREPGSIPLGEILPSVRVSHAVSFDAWREFLRDELRVAWRGSRELRTLALSLCARSDRRACARAVVRWVGEHVEHAGAVTDLAAGTLARRRGNRTGLVGALLLAAGIEPELWVVRPVTLDGAPLVAQELDAFDQPVLALPQLRGAFLDPRTRRLAPFALPPLLRGGQALRIAPGTLYAHLPRTSAEDPAEGRRVRFRAAVGEGPMRVEEQEDLAGWPAVEWREEMDRVDGARIRQEFEQHGLGAFFPGAQLESLTFRGLEDEHGRLGVDSRFLVPSLARRAGGTFVVAPILPSYLARRYAPSDRRLAALLVPYVPPLDLDVELSLPAGATLAAPSVVRLEAPFGRFRQEITSRHGRLVLRRHLEMPTQRVDPRAYPGFVKFARAVDEAEQREIVLRLSGATGP
jgi:hypothetical protein